MSRINFTSQEKIAVTIISYHKIQKSEYEINVIKNRNNPKTCFNF